MLSPAVAPRSLLALFVVGAVLRLGFVIWSPAVPYGDAMWYNAHARGLLASSNYTFIDGSPANQWMPGWPAFLAAVYAVFGKSVRAALVVNALLGAATCVLIARLGARLLEPRVGAVAGLIYAVWPGVVYFCATLMSETLFVFLLSASLLALVGAVGSPSPLRCALAGLVFGSTLWVKAEPLVLLVAFAAFILVSRRKDAEDRGRSGLVHALAFVLVSLAVLTPWTIRNYRTYGRVLATTAAGGINAWLGHHEGARGGQDFGAASRFNELHQRDTRAETFLATNDAGFQEAWRFALENPAAELTLSGRKLALTYGSDAAAVGLIRGVRRAKSLDAPMARRMRWTADVFWFGVLALVAVGVVSLSAVPPAAIVLLVGVPSTWLIVHLVFIGGPRMHVPETPLLALLAALGLVRCFDAARAPRAATVTSP